MGTVTKRYNYRVVIEPKGLGDFGGIRVSDSMFYKTDEAREKAYKQRCEEIVQDVKRHTDNVGNVYVDFDSEEVCEHCGYGWEIDADTGEPMCCSKAVEDFNNSKTKQQ